MPNVYSNFLICTASQKVGVI